MTLHFAVCTVPSKWKWNGSFLKTKRHYTCLPDGCCWVAQHFSYWREQTSKQRPYGWLCFWVWTSANCNSCICLWRLHIVWVNDPWLLENISDACVKELANNVGQQMVERHLCKALTFTWNQKPAIYIVYGCEVSQVRTWWISLFVLMWWHHSRTNFSVFVVDVLQTEVGFLSLCFFGSLRHVLTFKRTPFSLDSAGESSQ